MPATKQGDILDSPPATDAAKKAAEKAAAEKAAAEKEGDETEEQAEPKPNKDGKIPGTVLSFEEVQKINRKYPREVVTSNNRKKK